MGNQQVPLKDIDVSRPEIYVTDEWRGLFARLRQEAPVHYLKDSANGPFWSVTTHALIKEVDTNAAVFSSQLGGTTIDDIGDATAPSNFLRMDPPLHDVQRKAVAPAVAPSNLARLESLVRERAIDILEHLPVGETFDWVRHVSVELTARMLATLFDFPYEQRHRLIEWSDLATTRPGIALVTPEQEARRAVFHDEAREAFTRLWRERESKDEAPNLISMLIHGEGTGDLIDNPRNFMGNMMLLVVGGNDTTRNSISGGLIALNQYPDEYDKLRADPSLIPNMVAEIVRWQTPVIHMRRTATEDTELGGQKIRQGEKVVMWYLSGNRDESVYSDAERLVIDRPNARTHVSFGFGIHRCMGNRLAELQLRVLWEEIMQRFHRIEVVGEPGRRPSNFIRGVETLPVVVHPLS